jgi:Fe2+ or Zn2+ uptake regulation protein
LERDGCLHRVHEAGGGEGLVLSVCAHGHHVVCAGCGRVAEFSTCELRETIEGARQETGFVINEHYLELLGLCEQCAAASGMPVADG